jgi:hypothetical protein
MLMHGTKYQQCSSFVLGLGVFKLFITLSPYDWLRVHSVPDSISMVHQYSSNVYDPLLTVVQVVDLNVTEVAYVLEELFFLKEGKTTNSNSNMD